MVVQDLQTITNILAIWWMAIALYQFFDYSIDQLIYSDNLLHGFGRIIRVLLILPALPILKALAFLLDSVVQVKLYETDIEKD